MHNQGSAPQTKESLKHSHQSLHGFALVLVSALLVGLELHSMAK
jgi:hypothetical protein